MKPRSKTRNVLRFVGVTAAAAVATLATSLPANAAVDRTDCGNRTDILKLETKTGNLCFANPGVADVAIYGVDVLRPGNYTVTIAYQYAIGSEVLYVTRYPGQNWEAPMHKITKIGIWG
ncbi:beta/gamma crystallin domain-containing protein [Streptomyces sp. NY05-11A]|uniref:beta/gamma crystallin domain-containing protein n=1 Tax=Streptomyces soliscabiei TaxID=588897 RepID=UPI0029B4886C|nr:beta/gamma crystallin domain-containing protein [Streptomyces sp. NY05-11A]MDX2675527.1 beta/gamma crystallin domain-containing protein [Streptomyces sp. NY05-11A]